MFNNTARRVDFVMIPVIAIIVGTAAGFISFAHYVRGGATDVVKQRIEQQRSVDREAEATVAAFRGVPVRVFDTHGPQAAVYKADPYENGLDGTPQNLFGVERVLGTTDDCSISGGGSITLLEYLPNRAATFRYQPAEHTMTNDKDSGSVPANCRKPFVFQVEAAASCYVGGHEDGCEPGYYFNRSLDNLKAFAEYDNKLRQELQNERQLLTNLRP